MKSIIFFSTLLLICAAVISKRSSPSGGSEPPIFTKSEKVKGVCWEARDSIGIEHLQSLEQYHINWISQTPFGWQQEYNSPEIAFHSNRGLWGERDIGLIHTAQLAKKRGIKTLLKPHIWLTRSSDKWRSDIEMDSPEEWQQWFDQYELFILHHARLAEANGFEGLCIGTELHKPAVQHEKEWRKLIAKIRQVYSGQLTYAANFYQEYEEIQFWDALDFIGLQAYFPLASEDEPSLKTLGKGWNQHYQKIKDLHNRWQKPVVFTEVGYRSSKDAAIRPWEWENRGEVLEEHISPETQARCYQAMFQTFWKEDWMAGVFLWKWTQENYKLDYQPSERRPLSPLSFTPKKEGLEVIRKWFGESAK